MLTTQNISCEKNEQILFSRLSLQLAESEVMQIKGENGCGKTSLLRILCGLAEPEKGKVLWGEKSISLQRERYFNEMLYIGHLLGLKSGLTARENLEMAASNHKSFNNLTIDDALAKVNLSKRKNVFTQNLSAGQKRRVCLAKLLLVKAKLWILDEPFTALDTLGVNLIKRFIEDHAAAGGMVIFTSHQRIDLSCSVKELDL